MCLEGKKAIKCIFTWGYLHYWLPIPERHSPLPVNHVQPDKHSAWRGNGISQPKCLQLATNSQQTGSGVQLIYHHHSSSEGSFSFWICSVGPVLGTCGTSTSYANGGLSHHKTAKSSQWMPLTHELHTSASRHYHEHVQSAIPGTRKSSLIEDKSQQESKIETTQ